MSRFKPLNLRPAGARPSGRFKLTRLDPAEIKVSLVTSTPTSSWGGARPLGLIARLGLAASLVLGWGSVATARARDFQGKEFVGITHFGTFVIEPGNTELETIFTSPILRFHLEGDECILSWNVELAPSAQAIFELRAIYPDRTTKYFTMGIWSGNTTPGSRRSVRGQSDAAGNVDTDILRLAQKASEFQIR